MLLKGKTKNEIENEHKRRNTECAILELKKYLSETDFIIIKCLEIGKNPCDEYADVAAKRNEARTLINKLEKELEAQP